MTEAEPERTEPEAEALARCPRPGLSTPIGAATRPQALAALALLAACAGEAETPPSTGWPEVPEVYRRAVYSLVVDRAEAEALWREMPLERITLESKGCWGVCPVYQVELLRGGEATFVGVDHVEELEGTWRGRVGLSYFARLCLFFERFRFADMDSKYAARWTDDNTMILSVTPAGGEPITVSDYGAQAPPEFHALTLAIEEVVREVEWQPADEVRLEHPVR